eukprot:6748898-Karenia_brevis.AAC.1
MQGVRLCLQYALDHGSDKVYVECDSRVVVDWVRGERLLHPAAAPALRDLYAEVRNLFFRLLNRSAVRLRWISRNCNGTADVLAKRAAQDSSFPWTRFSNDMPDWLSAQMASDGF